MDLKVRHQSEVEAYLSLNLSIKKIKIYRTWYEMVNQNYQNNLYIKLLGRPGMWELGLSSHLRHNGEALL